MRASPSTRPANLNLQIGDERICQYMSFNVIELSLLQRYVFKALSPAINLN